MSVDFKYLDFSPVFNQQANNLTEALRGEPVPNGFVFLSFKMDIQKTTETAFFGALETYLRSLDNKAIQSIKIYRQLKENELGGIVPFDQGICEKYLDEKMNVNFIIRFIHKVYTLRDLLFKNKLIDVGVYISCTDHAAALSLAHFFENNSDMSWRSLLNNSQRYDIGAFKNMAIYSTVSDDPNKIQFFNLFPAPGKLESIWHSWLKSLPWFFEIANFRSSFPLLALNESQKTLLINAAHWDSAKGFIIGANYDPAFKKILKGYMKDRVSLPYPFFCKIEKVIVF